MFTNVISHGGGVLSILLSALCLISCTNAETDSLGKKGGSIRLRISASGISSSSSSSPRSPFSRSPKSGSTRSAESSSSDVASLEQVLPLVDNVGGDTLYLRASISDYWGEGAVIPGTKASVATAESFHESIGCFGYYMTNEQMEVVDSLDSLVSDGELENCGISANNFSNEKVTKADGGEWVLNKCWYSYSGGGLNQWIVAYAPYVDDLQGLTVNPIGRAFFPSFDYTVPDAVADQTDLMFAVPTDLSPDDPYTLSFQHVLSGVRFMTKDMEPGTVSKVSLKNVYGTGHYDYFEGGGDIEIGIGNSYEYIDTLWHYSGELRSFSQNLSKSLSGSYGQRVTDDECTFMMMPQTLPQNACIEVEYTPAGTDTPRTLTANIGGTVWGMGRMHSYFISYNASGAHLVVTPMEEFSHDGGSKDFSLSSYTRANGASTPAPWTAQFVNKNPDGSFSPATSTPTWVHLQDASGSALSSLSGSGSTSSETFKVSVDASTSVQGNPHNDALSQATPKGSAASPWNLSSASGSLSSESDVQNTANCYIINAPGTYCLPLVYGNAIKNGQANAEAYSTTVVDHSGEADVYDEEDKVYMLSTFKNHLDSLITSPWIDNNDGCTSDNATLVWQDEQSLVSVESTLKTVDNKKFLVFTVPASSIKQGNAIIAVRNAQGTIMWSWHIWVTDYVPNLAPDVDDPMRDKVVQNHSEQHDRYTMMPLNLGWTDNYTESYPERIAYIQFTQTGTNRTDILEVKQRSYTGTSWSNTYYQWGRKDPMLGATKDPNSMWGDNGVDKAIYTTDSNLSFKVEVGYRSLGEAISAPNVFLKYNRDSDNYDWCSTHYSNLWDADFVISHETTEYDNIKTIYDPCPVGYKVSPYNAFDGVSHTGDYASGYDNNGNYSGIINTPYSSRADFEANYGFEFFCNLMHGVGQFDDKGGTIFFPASGYRDYYSGVGRDLGSDGYFWSAAADRSYYRYCLYFDSSSVYPRGGHGRANGDSVRPVQE